MSRFERFKLEQEERRKKSEADAVAAAEAAAKAQEEEDEEAEAEAAKAGKATAADLEANATAWPFGQVYSTPLDAQREKATPTAKAAAAAAAAKARSDKAAAASAAAGAKSRRRRSSHVFSKDNGGLGLAEEAKRAHAGIAKREAAKIKRWAHQPTSFSLSLSLSLSSRASLGSLKGISANSIALCCHRRHLSPPTTFHHHLKPLAWPSLSLSLTHIIVITIPFQQG